MQPSLLPTIVHRSRQNDQAVVGPILDMAGEVGSDGFCREQTAMIARPDSRPLLVEIGVPTVVIVGRQDQATPLSRAQGDGDRHRQCTAGDHRGLRPHGAAGEAGRGLGALRRWLTNDDHRLRHRGSSRADEYIDVVKKSGLNRPVEDRSAVERFLKHSNLFVTARQDGRLVGFARSLTDFCFCCYLSDLAVDKACQGQGIGKR